MKTVSEKTVFKLRLVKTDEGLRVEIKGDHKLLHGLARERHWHHYQYHHERRLWSRWERRFRHGGHHRSWWHDVTEA